MKNMINQTHIEGILYNHDLEMKVSKKTGSPYIYGTIDIATDDNHTNIVTIRYKFVSQYYAKKDGEKEAKANKNYPILKNIIDGQLKTVMNSSWDEAATLRVDSAIGLNEYYNLNTPEEQLVSRKCNQDGFVSVISRTALNKSESNRSTFKADMVITGAILHEADEEKEIPEYLSVKGCVFDFRGAMLPVEFSATNKSAINYFLGLDASAKNPVFTNVWGMQLSTTIKTKVTEESAFGEPVVRETSRSRKDWVITGARANPYDWDDNSTITANELKQAMSEREIMLAAKKQEQIKYKAEKGNNSTPFDTNSNATSDKPFDF